MLPKVVPEPAHTLRESHSHEVRPGGNFDFLRDHIMRHLTAKSEFRATKRSASQASAAAGSSSSWKTVHSEPFQDTSHPESTCDPSDILHMDTHMPTTRSCAVSVTSSLADSDLQAALAKSQRGITVKRHCGKKSLVMRSLAPKVFLLSCGVSGPQ